MNFWCASQKWNQKEKITNAWRRSLKILSNFPDTSMWAIWFAYNTQYSTEQHRKSVSISVQLSLKLFYLHNSLRISIPFQRFLISDYWFMQCANLMADDKVSEFYLFFWKLDFLFISFLCIFNGSLSVGDISFFCYCSFSRASSLIIFELDEFMVKHFEVKTK